MEKQKLMEKQMFKHVDVSFNLSDTAEKHGKEYTFLAPTELFATLKLNDLVIVDTINGFKIVRVIGLKDIPSDGAPSNSKLVFQKVDTSYLDHYNKLVAKKRELEYLLDKAFKEAQRYQVYQVLAENNPKIAGLMRDLSEFNPELKMFLPVPTPDLQASIAPDEKFRKYVDKQMSEADVDDYDDWVNIGELLYQLHDGSDVGLNIWDDWSKFGEGYPGYPAMQNHWKSFGTARPKIEDLPPM